MNLRTESLRLAFAAVCARDGVDVAALPAPELLELSGHVAQLRRDADVLMAEVASEIRRRSDVVDVGVGLATRQGFRSAKFLVAQVTGGSVAQARRLMDTGDLLVEAARGECEATPSPLTLFRRDLAALVRAGRMGVDVSSVFTVAVEHVPDVERTRDLFTQALTKAEGLPLHEVHKLVWQAQAFADPTAWEEREERQYEKRTLTLRDDADGMVTVTATLTPLAAAPVRAVLDAGVRWAMQRRRNHPETDTRSPWQMRADILVDLCRHALDCSGSPGGVKTTVIVRTNQTDLTSGSGLGSIDGMPQPVSVRALRLAAGDAEVIPVLVGEGGEILNWGRTRRHFTRTQRLALVERDDGCAWCNAPPSYCDAHHIRWWERDTGPTDLNNGVLLCTHCHHRIHRDGWDINVQNQAVTFIPPTSIDPARTPHTRARPQFNIAA